MGEFFKWIAIIIIAFAVIGFFFSEDGKREDGAKLGAVSAVGFILSILPTVIVVFLIILLVRACV